MKNLFWLLLFSVPVVSVATTPKLKVPNIVCASAKSISEKAKGCEDNGLFVQAAQACLALIDLEAKKIGLTMKGPQGVDLQSQKKDMKVATKEYFEMTRKLDYIIGVTEIAKIDTYNYAEHIFLPEDESDDPAENKAVACFGENSDALESIAEQMDKKQREFEAVLEITKTKLLQTQSNGVNLGAIDPAAAAPVPGATNAPVPKPKNKPMVLDIPAAPGSPGTGPKGKDWGASDITGTEKKAAPKK